MSWIALKMLTGDTFKYLFMIFAIAFATLLMAQQASIFWGLMRNTTSQITDVEGADIWVMDPNVRFVDDIKPLSENETFRVRGVPGVKWAVRFYKGQARARFEDGNFQQFLLLGVDDATLVGAPRPEKMILGTLGDLRIPDACVMDEAGYRYLWPGEPFEIGRTLEMNDHRAVIVGICKASPTFQTFPIVYTTYSQATRYVPSERKVLSFVLAQGEDGVPTDEVCRRIHEQTGLAALTRDQFINKTILYYLQRTGIAINFGITVSLGFFVGAAVSGLVFFLFTLENLKQFGALKAMGVSNIRIVGMILLQGSIAGLIGYGIGVGGAAAFGVLLAAVVKTVPPAFNMHPYILVGSGVAVLLIVVISSLFSIRRVMVVEPAIVFR
jgi:putative ABC transport system permease protein